MPLRSRLMRRLWSDAESAYRAKILDDVAADAADRLLDVGCDDGAWTDVVRRRLGIEPDHVQGLEIVDERAAVAAQRGFDVRVGDLEARWPFNSSSVDLVHANQVIEHVKRLDHFVAETKRVLRPAGRAIVCTENLSSWHNVFAVTLGYQPFSLTNISSVRPIGNPLALHDEASALGEPWQHVHVLSLSALRDLFVAHGFKIDSLWGAGYHPFAGRLASRLASFDPRHAHFVGLVARRSADENGRVRNNLVTIAAALYVLLPFDIIPDFIPYVGHFDDAIIVALVVRSIKRRWFKRAGVFMRRLFSRPVTA